MNKPIQAMLPVAPLLAYCRFHLRTVYDWAEDETPTATDMAAVFGVRADRIQRWRSEGQLPFWQADNAACSLNVHPAFIWGEDYWWQLLAANDRWELSVQAAARRAKQATRNKRARQHIERSSGVNA